MWERSCMSVCSHVSSLKLLNVFRLNFVFGSVLKSYQMNSILVRVSVLTSILNRNASLY
jgi:hypothetical protein